MYTAGKWLTHRVTGPQRSLPGFAEWNSKILNSFPLCEYVTFHLWIISGLLHLLGKCVRLIYFYFYFVWVDVNERLIINEICLLWNNIFNSFLWFLNNRCASNGNKRVFSFPVMNSVHCYYSSQIEMFDRTRPYCGCGCSCYFPRSILDYLRIL